MQRRLPLLPYAKNTLPARGAARVQQTRYLRRSSSLAALQIEASRARIRMKLGITDYIDCAHFLPGHPKCGRLHGHTYKIEIIIEGETGSEGMVLDFGEMKQNLQSVLGQYDHQSLNDFLDYPSVENVCEALSVKLREKFSFPFSLRVWEGHGKWAEL